MSAKNLLPPVYRSLSAPEQNKIIERISAYRRSSVYLSPIPRFLSAEQQQFVREGAHILLHFPNCIQSVQPILSRSSLSDRDAKRVFYLIEMISKELASEMAVTTPSGDNVILLSQSQALRRGRPTTQESEQRRAEQQQRARAEALSNLTGNPIVQPEPAAVDNNRPTDTSRRRTEPDLFSSAVSSAIDSASSAPVPEASPSGSPSESLKALREWAWILPADLQANVKAMRDMRSRLASHSEQAKLLLEQGARQADIAEHTLAASRINEEIAATYEGIDRHLAVMYIMLSGVNAEYGNYAERYAERGGLPALLADLKPYYDKLTVCDGGADNAVNLLAKARRLEEARIARETRDPEKEKRIHAIKAYFTRKDVKASAARLEKLRAYFEEAKQLSIDDDTLSVFQLIINDCESSLTPNQ